MLFLKFEINGGIFLMLKLKVHELQTFLFLYFTKKLITESIKFSYLTSSNKINK